MSVMDKLKKTSTVKATQVVAESPFFATKDLTDTGIPMLNVALSGDLTGGLASGLTVIAGPSKHFKSNISLVMAAAYLRKYDDAVLLIYDTEFGITPEYLANFGIDNSRVLHTPIEHAEQLKFDIIKQLEEIDKGDKVMILIDSVGNLASKKELEDALDGKSVADMTRAKVLKGSVPYGHTLSEYSRHPTHLCQPHLQRDGTVPQGCHVRWHRYLLQCEPDFLHGSSTEQGQG